MKIRLISAVIAISLLCAGCAGPSARSQRHEATYFDVFDTVTTVMGYNGSREAFETAAQTIYEQLLQYHQLFDIYLDYPGISNLKTVNDRAGIAPVKVDEKIIDLLLFCRQMYEKTGGRVNIAMGSVLTLWHDARTLALQDPTRAALPDMQALKEAARHTDFSQVIIDREACTVYFQDPQLRLDVGAIAKGYAAQQVCRNAPEGMLVSVGGNVCATGTKPDGSQWVVGIENPDKDIGGKLHTLSLSQGAVVTSGDYQRCFTVDGFSYHHIIDPDTLMPGTKWRAVTVVCEDSAVADALSTALFLLPQKDGAALAAQWNAEAVWIDPSGKEFFTPGFDMKLKS